MHTSVHDVCSMQIGKTSRNLRDHSSGDGRRQPALVSVGNEVVHRSSHYFGDYALMQTIGSSMLEMIKDLHYMFPSIAFSWLGIGNANANVASESTESFHDGDFRCSIRIISGEDFEGRESLHHSIFHQPDSRPTAKAEFVDHDVSAAVERVAQYNRMKSTRAISTNVFDMIVLIVTKRFGVIHSNEGEDVMGRSALRNLLEFK